MNGQVRREIRASWTSVILMVAAATGSAGGEDLSKLVGRWVMPKRECRLIDGDKVLDQESLSLPYFVTAVEGDRLVLEPGFGSSTRAEVVTQDEAIPYYTRRIETDPRDGWSYLRRGVTYYWTGDYEKAIADYDAALAINARDQNALHLRGLTRYVQKDYDGAISDMSEAIAIQPKGDKFYYNRGRAYEHKGDFAAAAQDFLEAVRLEPESSGSLNAAAWTLATAPNKKVRDGKRAIELGTKASELTNWKDGGCIDSLAAGYAEIGDFEKAIEFQEKALACAPEPSDFRTELETHLASYRRGKPWRNKQP